MRYLVLAYLFALGLVLGFAVPGCNSIKDTSRDVAGDLVDCTAGQLGELAPHVIPFALSVLNAARRADGSVDWSALTGIVTESAPGQRYEVGKPLPPGVAIVACALAAAVARETSGPVKESLRPVAPAADPRAGFASFARERWGGRRFRVAPGAVL